MKNLSIQQLAAFAAAIIALSFSVIIGFIVDSSSSGVSFGEKLVNMGQRCSGIAVCVTV